MAINVRPLGYEEDIISIHYNFNAASSKTEGAHRLDFTAHVPNVKVGDVAASEDTRYGLEVEDLGGTSPLEIHRYEVDASGKLAGEPQEIEGSRTASTATAYEGFSVVVRPEPGHANQVKIYVVEGKGAGGGKASGVEIPVKW